MEPTREGGLVFCEDCALAAGGAPANSAPGVPKNSAPPIMGDEMVPSWGRKPIQGNGVDYLMEGDLERKAEQALVAITLSTATLIVCVGLLVLR